MSVMSDVSFRISCDANHHAAAAAAAAAATAVLVRA